MSNIIFIQSDTSEYAGVMSMAALSKKYGHNIKVLINLNTKTILEEIRNIKPDLVAFSCLTASYPWALKEARIIKQNFLIPIIFGGYHPTFNPEIISEPAIDLVCCGEGEYPLLELLNSLEKKEDFTTIKNLWVKQEGRIYKNDVRNFIADLDALPFPDRSVYYGQYNFLRNYPVKHFMSSRGCPFNCSFCYNHQLLKIYNGKGKYVRRKSPEYFLKEMGEIKERYGYKVAIFDDDIFAVDAKWLSEFMPEFREEIKVPFACSIRVDVITEEIVRLLKKGGCFQVSFGVESGNEELRATVLKKRISDKQIIEAAKLLRHYKIPFLTNNMIGIPTETVEQACETIKLNARIGTDVPWCSILQPFPKTDIANFAIEKGLLAADYDKNFEPSFFFKNQLKQDNIQELWNLQKFFILAVKFPFLLPFIKRLIKLKPNKFFEFVFLCTYFTTYKRRHNLNWFTAFLFGWQTRRQIKITKNK